MGKIKRIIFIACFLAGMLCCVAGAQDFEAIGSHHNFEGEIIDIDEDIGEVIVKYVRSKIGGSYEQVNCPVTEETRIIKDGKRIDMSQLFPGDKVVGKIFINDEGIKITTLIKVVSDE